MNICSADIYTVNFLESFQDAFENESDKINSIKTEYDNSFIQAMLICMKNLKQTQF